MAKTLFKLEPQNFELFSGNHKTLNFTHRDKVGDVVDITGATISWALAIRPRSKRRIIFYTSPTNIAITDGPAGEYEVRIQDTDTEPLTPRKYYHEVRITDASGRVTTAAYGFVEVQRNVIDT